MISTAQARHAIYALLFGLIMGGLAVGVIFLPNGLVDLILREEWVTVALLSPFIVSLAAFGVLGITLGFAYTVEPEENHDYTMESLARMPYEPWRRDTGGMVEIRTPRIHYGNRDATGTQED